jgi:hypothetical protein
VAIESGRPSLDADRRAVMVDGETLMLLMELEVRQAIRLAYFVSLLVVQTETGEPAAQEAGPASVPRFVANIIRGHIRNTDAVSVTGASSLHVLLVSSDLDNLPGIIRRIAAAVNARSDAPGGARLTLSIGGACFPTTARGRAELVQQAEVYSVEAREARGDTGHRYRLAHSLR